MLKTNLKKIFIFIPLLALVFWISTKGALAQTPQASQSSLYVPLIGLTSVPDPLTLPSGAGDVTYQYAVKNFLSEVALADVQVVDDNCSPVKFLTGDDNGNSKLDYNEVWRYSCTTKLSKTTDSIATATGIANNTTAKHSANTTVVVGSDNPPPLVSIVNVTRVVDPLPLPAEGNNITFTYKVTNPGVVPLGGVIVADDKCSTMPNKLGDTNANNLLDLDEVWIYTCATRLTQTTTNTATVTAYANGLKAVDNTSLTVRVDTSAVVTPPLFDVAISPNVGVSSNFKIIAWAVLSGVLMALIISFGFIQKNTMRKKLIYIRSRVKNNHDEISS